MSNEQEVRQLRAEALQLQQRLDDLHRRLDALSVQPAEPPAPPVISVASPLLPADTALPTQEVTRPAAPPVLPPPVPRPEAESFEVRLGTFWLPRIGMALLLTGMVFLVTWSYRYMGAPGKVALSYLCCALLGGTGLWLERKTPLFARILQAGALALTYFVTYAAHFIPTFRVIASPFLALTLLSVVVAGIVIVADRRKSPSLAGLALFFGYYTSLVSGVDSFTLAANAVLAMAAMIFLARNRWVPISYGAVLATYLAYMLWVLKFNRGTELGRLIFDRGYLDVATFRLRAAFLALYWLLFAGGGLMVRRETLLPAERGGLLTLNNVFFFILFTLLMHHAFPNAQWQFQFLFAGALLIAQRFAQDRAVMETIFVQGLAVATLGLISYFEGGRLVAALAVESLFVLLLARWMDSRWIAWVARAAFATAVVVGWPGHPGLWSVWFAAVAGYVCARIEKPVAGASFFAFAATAMAMRAADMHFVAAQMPWVWMAGALIVAVIAAVLRLRPVFWSAQLPLAWALLSFCIYRLEWSRSADAWTLTQSLVLIAVTFGFGIFLWARLRAHDDLSEASLALLPYATVAVLAGLLTTLDECPARWRLLVFSVETLTLVMAGRLAGEATFTWLAMAPMAAGVLAYFRARPPLFLSRHLAWTNFVAGLVCLVAAERAMRSNDVYRRIRAGFVVMVTGLGLMALCRLLSPGYLTFGWAVLGFTLLAFGFTVKSRAYRIAGLVALAFGLMRAVFYDLAKLETLQRILSFLGLGTILLVLAYLYARNREKISKWL